MSPSRFPHEPEPSGRARCATSRRWEHGAEGSRELAQTIGETDGSSSAAYLPGCMLSPAGMSQLALEVGKLRHQGA